LKTFKSQNLKTSPAITNLICQRTTASAVFPSDNNTLRFQFLQLLIDPCPDDVWTLVLGQWAFLAAPFHAPSLAQISCCAYDTLHGLHDPNRNEAHPKSLLAHLPPAPNVRRTGMIMEPIIKSKLILPTPSARASSPGEQHSLPT
jgi:hypothetical protein